MQTLPRIHNSNSHSNFHLAYSLLVSACVQSSTDELAQNVRNVGGKNTVTMPYFYGFVPLVGCLKSVSQSPLVPPVYMLCFQVVHWQSPHMHAYYPALTSWPSLLGDMLADAINCLGFTWVSNHGCSYNQWKRGHGRK